MIPRRTLSRDEFRFELRPYDCSCVPELYQAATESRHEISPWMAWLHPKYERQDLEFWTAHAIAAWNTQSEYEFLIYDRQDGAVLGSCGLNNINRKDMVSNLGYWVRTSRTRLGAATQAARLLQEFGLKVAGFNRVEIVVAEGNAASRRVAEKAGALYEGLQRRRVRVGDRVYDAHMYAFV
jgi:ribosomal-protein-serine acetyltransferase